MTDWPVVAARLALYGDLGLLFGLPLFTTSGDLWRRAHIARWCVVLAPIGIVTSLIGFGIQLATMMGVGITAIDPAIASAMLQQTSFGWAMLARLAALALALPFALCLPAGQLKRWLLILLAATALASLAWSGHAAAGEGAAGWAHLAADILHLFAASAWIGALVMLLALVSPSGPVTAARVDAAHDALARFSSSGTFIVALIVATGLLNSAFLLDPSAIGSIGASLYLQLLLAKLALFSAMLGCAALNRFRLTPRLATARSPSEALGHLRISIAAEALLALLVLALVAWLGTLAPPVPG